MRNGYSRESLRVEKSGHPGANGGVRMSVAARLAHMKKSLRVRAAIVGMLEELPFICPVVVAIGSLIMMGMTLWKDWPQ